MQRGEARRGIGRAGVPLGIERAQIRERGVVRGLEFGVEREHARAEGEAFFREHRAGEGAGGGFFLVKGSERGAQLGEAHEKFSQRRRHRRGGGELIGRFEFEQMAQSPDGIAQRGVGGIGRGKFCRVPAPGDIGMASRGGAVEAILERLRVEPRAARLRQDGKMIGHARAGNRAAFAGWRKAFSTPAAAAKSAWPRGGGSAMHCRAMRPRHLFLLLLLGALGGCSPRRRADEAAIFAVLRENVSAMQREDIEAVMKTVHPGSPDFEGTRLVITDIFAKYDLKFDLRELKVINSKDDEVKVSFVQKTENVGGAKDVGDAIAEGVHTLRKDGAEWKIVDTVTLRRTPLKP